MGGDILSGMTALLVAVANSINSCSSALLRTAALRSTLQLTRGMLVVEDMHNHVDILWTGVVSRGAQLTAPLPALCAVLAQRGHRWVATCWW